MEKPPSHAPDAVRAALEVNNRLRSGVRHRKGGAGYKVEPVPNEVAARVTVDAVAVGFPAGKTGGGCGLCERDQASGLSVQCARLDGRWRSAWF